MVGTKRHASAAPSSLAPLKHIAVSTNVNLSSIVWLRDNRQHSTYAAAAAGIPLGITRLSI